MSALGRVVWQEGMHLSQHHFQAQNRYAEELVRFVATSLHADAWGLLGCELDAEALKNDTVSLIHGRGLMPDGLPFDFPGDALPAPRQIRDLFSPTQESHLVLLCVPPFLEGRANVAVDVNDGNAARFTPLPAEVTDEGIGTDSRRIDLARKNFRLLLDSEESSRLVTLPIARVRRDGSGHFVYDERFIPPCLRIGASPAILAMLGRLVESLVARSDALAVETRGNPDAEIASHWLAHAIHSSLGPLLHHHRIRHAHPADLFVEMARLAGALCTFSMHAHPRELPTYDHARSAESFTGLERRILEMLNLVAPASSLRFPLRPVGESFLAATVDDSRCYAGAEWYLAVRSSAAPVETAARVPRLVNVCSARHIQRLVREAIPGLPLTHLITPPPRIAPRPGTEYFALNRAGPCWMSIVESHEVGVYAPAAIGDAELELVVALPE
ncbi:MAG TPA: type VI secretion system baseplate subunit TssK [Longimicrobiaceae bacterium]